MRIPYISLVAAGALALGGCAYGGLGYGYGDYGWGGPYVGVGIGGGYYDSGYYDPYYAGYGYGAPDFGWYDNYYYPGTGSYVYDSYRRPHTMTTVQRTYWSSRSPSLRTGSTTRARENWSGFNRRTSYRRRGTGYYVYDSYRRPHAMTTLQRTYWSSRSPSLRSGSTSRARANWSGVNRRTSYRRRSNGY